MHPHAELSLPVPSDGDSMESFKDGLTMFISFACFGLLPILGFVVASLVFPGIDTAGMFTVACSITAASLFGLGAFKAKFHDKRYVYSGCETVGLAIVKRSQSSPTGVAWRGLA